MSFIDQKPFVVRESEYNARWSGYKDGRTFRCILCGDYFRIGDTARFIYMNDTRCGVGNCFVCSGCDGDDIKQRIIDMAERANKYWWLKDSDHLPPRPELPKREKDQW